MKIMKYIVSCKPFSSAFQAVLRTDPEAHIEPLSLSPETEEYEVITSHRIDHILDAEDAVISYDVTPVSK